MSDVGFSVEDIRRYREETAARHATMTPEEIAKENAERYAQALKLLEEAKERRRIREAQQVIKEVL